MSNQSQILGEVEKYREALAGYLRAQTSMFDGIVILTRKQGDIISKINEAFNSAGVFGEVRIARVKAKRSQARRVFLDRLDFTVDWYENVPLNQGEAGTHKGAWWLAEQALLSLNFLVLPGYASVIMPTEGVDTLEDVTKDPDSGDLVVRVHLTTVLDLSIAN